MNAHPRGRTAGMVVLALAGLAVAVLLSVAASNLSTQPIGISGDLNASSQLAPRAVVGDDQRPPAARPKPKHTGTSVTQAPTVPANTVPVPTGTTTTPQAAPTSTGATPFKESGDDRFHNYDGDDD